MIKKQIPGSLFSVGVSSIMRKSKFFHQIDAVIDRAVFENERYKVCKRSFEDAAGRPAYNSLVLFKMMLLQTWYNLSDMGVEDTVPDHSTLSRFRSELIAKKAIPRLLAKRNAQLAHQGVWVQQGGGIIDASITPTARKPQVKFIYMFPEHPGKVLTRTPSSPNKGQ